MSQYRWKYKAHGSFVALRADNDLSFRFRVICYVWISFLTSVCSYCTFRRNTKLPQGDKKSKYVIKTYIEIEGSCHVSDYIFKINAKSYVYMEVFGVNVDFLGELGTKSWFWPKSCFGCSRTAASVPDQTDPGFEFTMVESTPGYLKSCFFYRMCATP